MESQSTPGWLKPWSPPRIPDNYQSPGNLHKIIADTRDTDQLNLLKKISSLAVFQYQQRRLYLITSETLARVQSDEIPHLRLRDDQNLIRLRDRFFDTTVPVPEVSDAFRIEAKPESQLHIIQFAAPVRNDWLDGLRAMEGLSLVAYLPENAYLVWADQAARDVLAEQAQFQRHVQWQGPFHPSYKLHPGFNLDFTGNAQATIQVFAHPGADASIDTIKNEAVKVLNEPRQTGVYHNIIVELPAQRLKDIARMEDVVNIEPYVPDQPVGERQGQISAGALNVAGTGPNAPGYLAWLNGLGFNANFDFAIDITDDGFDQGETAAANVHPVFLDNGGASRVVYVRRVNGTAISATNDENAGGHGTINAGIAGGFDDRAAADPDFDYHGDADGFRYGLGIAPYVQIGATQRFSGFPSPDWTTVIDAAYSDGARISNNSWAATVPTGSYDATSQEYDGLVRDARPTGVGAAPSGGESGNQEMVIVFAAGNDGPGATTVGDRGSTAKNTITVGATENFNDTGDADGCFPGAGCCDDNDADDIRQVIGFSSRGPTADGRVKPDIMAPGTHVMGPASQDASFDGSSVCGGPTNNFMAPPDDAYYPDDPDNTDAQDQDLYTWSSGTSHAAPAVAGGAALLRQWFLNAGHTPPSPAMTKAYLMNSATYMTGPADDLPSNDQGMGRLNLGMVLDNTPRLLFDQVKTAHDTAAVDATEIFTVTGQVADNTRPFRVTMAYTDAPGTPGAGTIRNNDLDLEVQVGGNFYRGNDFTQGVSNIGAVADPPDDANNVESVFLPAGTSGNFTVTVRPVNINSDGVTGNGDPDDQDFALVVYNAEFPARDPVDIILVLDVSGSMDGIAPGGTSPKIDLLKDAVEMFIRAWEPFATADDRMGVVYFSSDISATYPAAAPLLLPFSANADAFINHVRARSAGGCTALGGGILTALRGFDALPDRQRHIIVFTNGMQNRSPMVTAVAPAAHQILADPGASCGDSGIADEPGVDLADYNVKAIHTIGTGTPGAWTALVSAIAGQTGGQDHFTTTPDENLEDFFLEDLVAALRVDPVEKVATVTGTLTNADAGKTETFDINASVRKATFAVSWRGDRRPGALRFSLRAPDGTTIPASAMDIKDGPFYRIASLSLPLSGHTTPGMMAAATVPSGIQHAGTWSLVLSPDLNTNQVAYRIHLIVDDADIRYQFNAPTAGLGVGEPMPLSLWVQQGNRTLTNLTGVKVKIRRPPTGFGTFVATNPVSKDQLAAPIDLAGDQFLNQAGKKSYILFQNPALRKTLDAIEETVALFDDGLPEHGDAKAGDGVYSALYTKTERPGFYHVDMSFGVPQPDGSVATRSDSRTLSIAIERFDLDRSTIDIRPVGDAAYEADVLLIDKYGNYLGPGYAVAATVMLPDDKWGGRKVYLQDNLDGSYTGRVEMSPEERAGGAVVSIEAAGNVITQVPLPAPDLSVSLFWWWLLLFLLIIVILIILRIQRG
ncbi:MAG: S8 family serine peptidase [Thermodesulfobacteriota bacterium]|nr:S8 family serine peptidase [Thermodesulfobacteriota bacterium]